MGCGEARGHGFGDSGLQRAEVGRFMEHPAAPEKSRGTGPETNRLPVFHIEPRSQTASDAHTHNRGRCVFGLETISKRNTIKYVVCLFKFDYLYQRLHTVTSLPPPLFPPPRTRIFYEGNTPSLVQYCFGSREMLILNIALSGSVNVNLHKD